MLSHPPVEVFGFGKSAFSQVQAEKKPKVSRKSKKLVFVITFFFAKVKFSFYENTLKVFPESEVLYFFNVVVAGPLETLPLASNIEP